MWKIVWPVRLCYSVCFIREVKNRTGVDISVTSYDSAPTPKQVKNYHVVVITRLPFFKLGEHSEEDVVQFMVWSWLSSFKSVQTDSSPGKLESCVWHQQKGSFWCCCRGGNKCPSEVILGRTVLAGHAPTPPSRKLDIKERHKFIIYEGKFLTEFCLPRQNVRVFLGQTGKMVGNWTAASCYFHLCCWCHH